MYVNKKYESELEEFEVHLKDMEKQATIIKSEISKCDTKIKIAERDVERLNIRVESASKGVKMGIKREIRMFNFVLYFV